MIKKLILAIIFFIVFFAQVTFAKDIFKVTSVNFDTSNAMIFLTSPDNTTEPILKNIKLVKLSNPQRAFFDIDSAVLTAPSQNLFFNSGGLKQIKVGQFTTNPDKIRVVLYFENGFSPDKISFLKLNNNLVIKLKDAMIKEDYFQNTYSDEQVPGSAFFEKLVISNQDMSKVKIAVNPASSDAVLGQIQQAFNASTAPQCAVKPVSAQETPVVTKDLKLMSKYYLNGVLLKQNGVFVNGFGSVGVEKPMYLTNPARVVFDLPNTIVDPELRNKEFKINDKESVKIGQFDSSNARIVITTDEVEKYIPVFSSDGQSLLITNSDKIDLSSLFTKTTDAFAYYYKDINSTTDEFIIAFNAPVVHSVKRDFSKLNVYFYNALRYNEQTFKNTVKTTTLRDMKLELLPGVGLKLTLPLKKDNKVSCDLGADAKSIRITVKGPKPTFIGPVISPVKPRVKNCGRSVVLDPGHGGADYGAIREGINEKDINLDVAKRVEAILVTKGVSVAMTRKKDETVSLQDRTIFCENQNPNIFVSVHVNSSVKPEITGIETHYYHPESLDLARTVHSPLVKAVKTIDRGLFKSRFYVINHTSVPAILVEIGFISNGRERSELVSEQRKQQTAKAIADGILDYLDKK